MRQVILNFHGIGARGSPPPRSLEPGEADYWVTPEFFAETLILSQKLADRVRTDFTFDDGNRSDLEIAAEPLASAGISAQVFVLAGRLDHPGSLGADDIAALQKMGHGIGSHGADHVNWKTLDGTGQAREWETARAQIAAVAGHDITTAAIPFGAYNRSVLQGLKSRGYTRVYSSDGGPFSAADYPIPRSSPTADMTLGDIEAILLGRESLKTRTRRHLARAVKARM